MSISTYSTSSIGGGLNPQSILEMPSELVSHILSFTDLKCKQQFVMTSVNLLRFTISETNFQKLTELKAFIDHMLTKLSDSTAPQQKINLAKIRSSLNIKFPNLLQLKQYLVSVQNEIIDVLKTLSEEEITALESIPTPSFYENCFPIAKICSRIPEANNFPDERRWTALQNIYGDLIKIGEIDRAIKEASSIPHQGPCLMALRFICINLVKIGNVDRAIEIAKSIPEPTSCDDVLQAITEGLAKTGHIERAYEVTNSITDRSWRDSAFLAISRVFQNENDIEKALIEVNKISHQKSRGSALLGINRSLLKAKKFQRAIQVAKDITNPFRHDLALWEISDAFARHQNFAKAIEVANKINDPSTRSHLLQEISTAIENAGLITRIYERITSFMRWIIPFEES